MDRDFFGAIPKNRVLFSCSLLAWQIGKIGSYLCAHLCALPMTFIQCSDHCDVGSRGTCPHLILYPFTTTIIVTTRFCILILVRLIVGIGSAGSIVGTCAAIKSVNITRAVRGIAKAIAIITIHHNNIPHIYKVIPLCINTGL